MLGRLMLIGLTCCLAALSVPSISPAAAPIAAPTDGAQKVLDTTADVSELIKAYMAIESPSSQDLEKLLAEPAVRNYGATAATFLMVGNLMAKNRDPSASFDPDKNVRLFKLLEVLAQTPSAPPADNPEEARAIKLRDKMISADQVLASGLKIMVETFEAVSDPDSALKYYDQFKTLPQKPMVDLSRAGAAQALIRLYCRLGDRPSAVKVYEDFTGLARSTGVKLRRGQAAVSLVEAFSEAGRIDEALGFYAELERLPQDKYIEKDRVKAGRALVAAYKKAGDLKTAGEWEDRLTVEEERLRLLDEKDRAAAQKMMQLFGD